MNAAPSHAASSPFAISMQHGAKQRETRRTAPHQADDCIDLAGFWQSEANVTRRVTPANESHPKRFFGGPSKGGLSVCVPMKWNFGVCFAS